MKHLNYPIFYLDNEDIDSNGNLSHSDIPKNVPVLIMIQSPNCHWCKKAKPEYQKFANNYGYYLRSNPNYKSLHDKYKDNLIQEVAFVTTIDSEDVDSSIFNKIDDSFQGFPHFIVYHNNKRYTYTGDRTSNGLKKFIKSIV